MSAPPAQDRPNAVRFRLVAAVFAATVLLGVVAALLLHRSLVGADRVAARHVVAEAGAVLRLDLEKVMLFAPVRRAALPLINESALPERKLPRTRVQRFAAHSDVQLGRDTREVVVNFGPGPEEWSVIAAGNYPSGLLPALAEMFAEEGAPWARRAQTLVAPSGVALAQASDGALVLGSSVASAERALPATSAHERHGIPLRGALAFSGDPRRVGWLGAASEGLGELERIEARGEWSNPFEVTFVLTYAGEPPGDLEQRVGLAVRRLLGDAEATRLERAVGKPKLVREGARVRIESRWDHESLEIVADRVVSRLREPREAAISR